MIPERVSFETEIDIDEVLGSFADIMAILAGQRRLQLSSVQLEMKRQKFYWRII